MSTLAAVTARETAFVSGSGILHGITPGALDGFAVGALATGACCLVVAAFRLRRRSRLSAKDGMWGTGVRRSKVRRDYFAESFDTDPGPANATVTPELFAPEGEALLFPLAPSSELDEIPPYGDRYVPEASVEPFADLADSDVILPGTRSDPDGSNLSGRSSYHSKHRVTSSDADRRPESRGRPRHAAPSARLEPRTSGRTSALPHAART